jgi:hypothetical protein
MLGIASHPYLPYFNAKKYVPPNLKAFMTGSNGVKEL